MVLSIPVFNNYKKFLASLLIGFLFTCAQTVTAKEVYTLKFATLIPTGTSWSKTFDAWIKDVETKSQGRIKFKMYAGGVMGDEPDVLRKIRKGQLHVEDEAYNGSFRNHDDPSEFSDRSIPWTASVPAVSGKKDSNHILGREKAPPKRGFQFNKH